MTSREKKLLPINGIKPQQCAYYGTRKNVLFTDVKRFLKTAIMAFLLALIFLKIFLFTIFLLYVAAGSVVVNRVDLHFTCQLQTFMQQCTLYVCECHRHCCARRTM